MRSVSLENMHFDTVSVMKIIRKLKPKLSHGPDGITPFGIKKLGQYIVYPLSRFFESFLSVSQVPSEWKSSIVTPIFKKGISSNCSNYHPLLLCCAIQKIMERLIVDETLTYLRKHNVISKEQHGFLRRRSTVTNLLETTNDWTISFKNKHMTTAVYIDYSKAFDVVPHPKLFYKLFAYGICGSFLAWIKQLLTGRIQNTRVGNSLSESVPLGSGALHLFYSFCILTMLLL